MEQQKKPALTLDMKKQRIRIHKQTLHQLGDPDHIQLLVNPNQKGIILKACNESALLAHKITYKKDVDCELYSKELLRQLKIVEKSLEESMCDLGQVT